MDNEQFDKMRVRKKKTDKNIEYAAKKTTLEKNYSI